MRLAVAVLIALAHILPAQAADVAGTAFPDTVTVDGKTLAFNGGGLRTKFWVKVYAAALWVEQKSSDPAQLASSDQAKRVELVMRRAVDKATLNAAILEGFQNNSAPRMAALKDRIDRFMAMIPDTKEGDRITLTYVPGKGTSVAGTNVKEQVIEGKDFAEALFLVWLGEKPADAALKTGLTGK